MAYEYHMGRHEFASRPIARVRNDNVLIRVETEQDRYQGKITLPDITPKGKSQQLAKLPMWGRVVLVGPKAESEVSVGERVLTNRMAGQPVWIDGEEYRIVRLAALLVAEEVPVDLCAVCRKLPQFTEPPAIDECEKCLDGNWRDRTFTRHDW